MLPLVMAGGTMLGTGINAWMQYQAMREDRAAHKQSIKKQERIFERQFSEEKRQARVSERTAKEGLKLSKENSMFNRKQTFLNNFLTTLNNNPNARAQYIQTSRGRR